MGRSGRDHRETQKNRDLKRNQAENRRKAFLNAKTEKPKERREAA